jgi:hypothetical protein
MNPSTAPRRAGRNPWPLHITWELPDGGTLKR